MRVSINHRVYRSDEDIISILIESKAEVGALRKLVRAFPAQDILNAFPKGTATAEVDDNAAVLTPTWEVLDGKGSDKPKS